MQRTQTSRIGTTALGLILGITLLGTLERETRAVVTRHDRDASKSLALAESLDMTVRVSSGSGTLIAPTWVLTAAHVASGISPFEPYVVVRGERYGIKRIVLHPGGISRRRGTPPRVDLALVEIDRAVPDAKLAPLQREQNEADRTSIIAGYGDFGPGDGMLAPSDGKRRAATNVIDDVDRNRLTITFDAPPAGTDLEGMGGPGDSGGPLFLEQDGRMMVAGVSSAGRGYGPGRYGNRDVYMRVSSFAEWIDETIADPPASMVEIPKAQDLAKDGFPNTSQAKLIEAFFEAFNSDDAAALAAFAREHRADEARERAPDTAWVERIRKRRDEAGKLVPKMLAPGRRGDVMVYVHATEPDRHHRIGFLVRDRDDDRAVLVDVGFW